jgi:long-chain acyl-CoA synthetase
MPHISITAAQTPHKPAFIMANSGEMVTYGELEARSNQVAHLFRLCGLKSGDHVAIMVENCHQFLEITTGAMRAGIIFTPISTHLKEDETAYILQNCGAKLFVASHSLTAVAVHMVGSAEALRHFYMIGGIENGFLSWEETVDALPVSPIEDQAMGTTMLYSSGTTGKPKGVYNKPYTEIFDEPLPLTLSLGAAFGFGSETTYLSPAPLYHAAPLHYNMVVLDTGGTSIIMEKFDALRALELIQEHRVTHSQWVPIMFVRMLKLPEAQRTQFDTSSMQVAIHAAAPCPIDVKEQMIDWWGPVILEYYSSSEGAGFTLIDSNDWLKHKGSVGRPLFGVPHVLDEEGNELPAGEVGGIWFSDIANKFEYHNEPGKTAEAYNKDGWTSVGDMGYLDDEGYLYLTDRKNFTIISGGVNIYPAEIENLLINHEKVADVAVFGVPCDEFGETVQAVVQPANWVDATDETALELVEWLKERLSHIKIPRSLDFMEQLPRMDNGKLYKRHLMDAYRNRNE